MAGDPRVADYAKLLVERCIDPKPQAQILVLSTPLGRPLVEEVVKLLARRGAFALLRIDFAAEQFPVCHAWSTAAPDSLLAELAPIDRFAVDNMDGRITITAPENSRDGSDLTPDRYGLLRKAVQPYYKRTMGMEVPWVGCHFPTHALAQDAGMTLEQYEDFLYGACLIDWDAQHREMRRIADRFDGAREVRIVGGETDLRIGVEGRKPQVDTGHVNMPGGEFFFGPVEDSAEGVITYSEFPADHMGHEVTGIRLRFERGKVVDASAASGEAFLLGALETDEGARFIGELGIGCNRRIDRHTKSVLFDEKIHGTIHVALGASYPDTGGTNVSSLHWDMVKDLRHGGRIELDGEVVQENGEWLF